MSSNGLKKFVSIGLSSLMVVSSISVYAVEAPCFSAAHHANQRAAGRSNCPAGI